MTRNQKLSQVKTKIEYAQKILEKHRATKGLKGCLIASVEALIWECERLLDELGGNAV